MDEVRLAVGAIGLLFVGCCWATWWLIASSRRERHRKLLAASYARRYAVYASFLRPRERTTHECRGHRENVTVAELVEEAREQGEPTRLNWPEEDPDRARAMRPYVQDQFPTTILQRVGDSTEFDDDWE